MPCFFFFFRFMGCLLFCEQNMEKEWIGEGQQEFEEGEEGGGELWLNVK